MGWFFKSEEQQWEEAKQASHERRAQNGQRVTKGTSGYTAAQRIKDQARVEGAKEKGKRK